MGNDSSKLVGHNGCKIGNLDDKRLWQSAAVRDALRYK